MTPCWYGRFPTTCFFFSFSFSNCQDRSPGMWGELRLRRVQGFGIEMVFLWDGMVGIVSRVLAVAALQKLFSVKLDFEILDFNSNIDWFLLWSNILSQVSSNDNFFFEPNIIRMKRFFPGVQFSIFEKVVLLGGTEIDEHRFASRNGEMLM